MKNYLQIWILIIVSLVAMSCNSLSKKNEGTQATENEIYDRTHDVPVPDFALQLLKEGNNRFVKEQVQVDNVSIKKRSDLKEKGQKPFAIILTCSDSRVPPELIFDQGLGDLFVIRVAGNVVDSVVMGSIEYAAEHLHSSLVVVMGHEKCGAVAATIEGGEVPGSIPSICARIKPTVEKIKKNNTEAENMIDKVIEGNVEANVNILENNNILKHLEEKGKLKIIGATYHLDSGEVTFL